MSNKELQLLAEALNNGSEAEADGVKYVFMDENTVYRFENNRMKKVAAGLIKKANKINKTRQQGERVEEVDDDPPPKPKPKKKQPKPSRCLETDDDEGEQGDDEESEPDTKPIKKINKRLKKEVNSTPTVDLNEYYHTKNKLEFMTLELDRLNNKVSKLKQYKSIVNKITGGEYDQPSQYEPQERGALAPPPPQAEPQQSGNGNGKRYNDGLFMF